MISITVNGQEHQLDLEPDTPLLWAIRDAIGLTGTKFGCGIAQCGACTVHIDGEAMRSCCGADRRCSTAPASPRSRASRRDSKHPVQQAWLAEDVPQCGYCQSGQIMATAAFLKENPRPTDADIDANITNICRCGTYERLRRAIHRAADADEGLSESIMDGNQTLSYSPPVRRAPASPPPAASPSASALCRRCAEGSDGRRATLRQRRRAERDRRLDRDRSGRFAF